MSAPDKNTSGKSAEIVVFLNRRETECSECGAEILQGGMLTLTPEPQREALCLACADLDHLLYLGRGNAALTRRASKYTKLRAVVVQWSRTRQRYERQGILAEEAAIARAETECLDDATSRALQRERRHERDAQLDQAHVDAFAGRIRDLYPGCPAPEARAIAEHACLRSSGRVGRTAAARQLDEEAVTLAVIAAIRHTHTDYDELLLDGTDRALAHRQVADAIDTQLQAWRA